MKHKVCVITANRSEYGLLRWLMEEIRSCDKFHFQLIATGAHLSRAFGETCREIEKDGFKIDEKLEILMDSDSKSGIVKAMGLCSLGLSEAFTRLNPDMIVVLGDRYELLPIVSAALVMGIPVAHISGGDVTEGAIDNEVRNAVTQMASLHFPGTESSKENILRLTGNKNPFVYNVGEPGLDNFKKLELLNRQELADSLELDETKKWVMFTFHPETKVSLDLNRQTMDTLLYALLNIDELQIVASYANSDFGGIQLNNRLEELASCHTGKLKVLKSLGQKRYLSYMNECVLVAGNSSSGIVEAPALGIPVINAGDRQKGRHLCSNVISCSCEEKSIQEAVSRLKKNGFPRTEPDYYYGDGQTAERIVSRIADYLVSAE